MLEVVELSAPEARAHADALAALLTDVVAGGASVAFMADMSHADAQDFWRETVAGIESGRTILVAAFDGGRLVGTVLLYPCGKPNQPHRADVAKLLVHRGARRGGVATRLMEALEARARAWPDAAHARHRVGNTFIGVAATSGPARSPATRLCPTAHRPARLSITSSSAEVSE